MSTTAPQKEDEPSWLCVHDALDNIRCLIEALSMAGCDLSEEAERGAIFALAGAVGEKVEATIDMVDRLREARS